jgi:hypothetical protein
MGFPSSGHPDFGFILKAGCRLLPASHLLFRERHTVVFFVPPFLLDFEAAGYS